jgi:diguanylate cyclase (GGDEF)-like protein
VTTKKKRTSIREFIGRNLSVALKIGIPLALITVLAAVFLGIGSISETKLRLDQALQSDSESLVAVMQNEYSKHPGDQPSMVTSMQNLMLTRNNLERMRLYQGGFGAPPKVWASTDVADYTVKPTPRDLASNGALTQREVIIDGRVLLESTVPISPPFPNGVVSMGIYHNLDERNAAVAGAARRTAVAASIAILLELLILLPTIYLLVLRRIKRLGRAAASVADGDYSVRLPEGSQAPSRDELFNVARQFDHMISTVGARTRQQAAVADLGQKALAGTDPDELLAEAVDTVAEQLGIPFTAVMELTEEETLVMRAGHGWQDGVVGFATLSLDDNSQSAYTMRTDEPILMANANEETRFTPSPLQIEHGIHSGVSVIIPGSEHPFGVLAAHTDDATREFTKDDVSFVQSVANVLATGIERKRAEGQVAFLAHHDALTALPNRAMFEELLELALARARRQDLACAVLFLDLDNFKLVNDSLGHAAGDELLVQLAERLREATRDTDLVARQGGDEFLVLLADIEKEGETPLPEGTDNVSLVSESVAVRICQSLEAPFTLAGEEFYTSSSIGISMFPKDAQDSRSLLKNADAAMYRSKKSAPAGYVVYSSEASDPLGKLSMTTRLRKAVEGQNWVLHYQPIVELDTAEMTGVEALVRWQDPNGGIIPPGEFIPLAEEMGLIVAIGDWVMEEICRQSKAWREEGLDMKISFNISPRQLWQPEMVEKVLAHLATADVDPSQVVVEITESSAMTDPERTQRILWDLHARGVRLAIDDFGTGYSSLSRLKHMPVHTLKIDRSFVMDLPDDQDAGNMVAAVIQLAQSLGMTPLAEGIETQEQWDFLLEKGCQLGQGYYFSRPIPAEQILAKFKESGRNYTPQS